MKLMTRPEPQVILAACSLRRLFIDEPIDLLAGEFHTPAEFRACLTELRDEASDSLTLIVHLPREAGPLLKALAKMSCLNRLVLTGAALAHLDVSSLVFIGQEVVIEPDPFRAVVGTMLGLKSGETLGVLFSGEPGLPPIELLTTQGARWRRSWEAPEDGEFHHLPTSA